LRRLSDLPGAPLMLEHLSKPDEYVAAASYITAVGKSQGISFE
jgi:hypothetical protein